VGDSAKPKLRSVLLKTMLTPTERGSEVTILTQTVTRMATLQAPVFIFTLLIELTPPVL